MWLRTSLPGFCVLVPPSLLVPARLLAAWWPAAFARPGAALCLPAAGPSPAVGSRAGSACLFASEFKIVRYNKSARNRRVGIQVMNVPLRILMYRELCCDQ